MNHWSWSNTVKVTCCPLGVAADGAEPGAGLVPPTQILYFPANTTTSSWSFMTARALTGRVKRTTTSLETELEMPRVSATDSGAADRDTRLNSCSCCRGLLFSLPVSW
eukprot:CAMPEP_0175104654 /NCGR_PEP_ID=MMETSP0086_2-20121207/9884_1 /TAXON_ID=136419 /ORGANISM="Unknown Unknown, Strain D1" /LENGTH=107 /DNA_ID=CAMNT_0016380143 /DNA_START=86 /DNA_END=409 /DNA_ORIENTATION=-